MKKVLFAGRRRSYSLLLILAIGSVARAQDFGGRMVTSIQYDPEKQPIDPRDLQNAQLVRTGEPLDLKQVAGTIDRLFATGLYREYSGGCGTEWQWRFTPVHYAQQAVYRACGCGRRNLGIHRVEA